MSEDSRCTLMMEAILFIWPRNWIDLFEAILSRTLRCEASSFMCSPLHPHVSRESAGLLATIITRNVETWKPPLTRWFWWLQGQVLWVPVVVWSFGSSLWNGSDVSCAWGCCSTRCDHYLAWTPGGHFAVESLRSSCLSKPSHPAIRARHTCKLN